MMQQFCLRFITAAAPGLLMLCIALAVYALKARRRPAPMTPEEKQEMLRLLTRKSFITKEYRRDLNR